MGIPYFDAHCDTIARCLALPDQGLQENTGHVDLVRGTQLGRYAQIFALYHSPGAAPPDGMLAQCKRLYHRFAQEMDENAGLVQHCRTGADIDQAVAQGKMAALLSIEGADLLDCDPAQVALAAGWGVKFLNLTWNYGNAVSGSNSRESDRGLSPQGRDFVRELERCGIYPDVSHLSDPGFWDLCRMARGPVVASHSNSRAICPHPRNLTDDQFQAIRDSGGVVGINFYRPFVGDGDSLELLTAHIEHFLNLGGEKTVCFGGDLDGCDVLAGGLQGLQDIPLLYEALKGRGYPASLLEDLFWNNLRRMIR